MVNIKELENIGKMQEEGALKKEVEQSTYQEIAPAINADEFFKVVNSRRSVRLFTDKPVPEEVMQKSLSAALLAPNSSNLQPWEFYWIKTPEIKSEIIKACFSQAAAATSQEIVIAVARTDRWRWAKNEMLKALDKMQKEKHIRVPNAARLYYEKVVDVSYGQGPFYLLAPFKRLGTWILGHFKIVPREPIGPNGMKLWAVKSTALACQNFMLAMRAQGFDTCPMEGLDSKRVKKILSLGNHAHIVMGLACGERRPKAIFAPSIRFSREEFIKIV